MELINLEYIKQFNPCQSGIHRYIDAGYENFSGSIVEFLELEKLSFDDKKWVVFHENQKLLSDNLMREFALMCSLRAVERVGIPEVTYLYDIALIEYISGEKMDSAAYYAADSAARYAARYAADSAAYYAARYAADSAADSAAYYAAYSAAYSATNRSIEEKIQLDILINLIENGTTLK